MNAINLIMYLVYVAEKSQVKGGTKINGAIMIMGRNPSAQKKCDNEVSGKHTKKKQWTITCKSSGKLREQWTITI